MSHHVILGAGPAGVVAAERIRKLAPADSITLIGDEAGPAYSRMAIPYMLIGDIDATGTYLRKSPEHFAALKIEQIWARARSIDGQRKTISLQSGESLTFDTLLIATGSRPIKANIAGIDLPDVINCWTLDDAEAIIAKTKPGTRVLQLGAGFIGCIIMEALVARGVELRVVERRERMVARMMGHAAGDMIHQWCESKGVKVHVGVSVESIEGGTPMTVNLGDGSKVQADVVISAIGVRPSIDFLDDSGVQCQMGVLTDDAMQTNVPGVYAAGDCAEAFDPFSQRPIVSAIQPNAVDQARVAAANMVAHSRGLAAKSRIQAVTQINMLDTLGLISTSFGAWQGVSGGDGVELTDKASGRHLSLHFKDDVMVGSNSVGWTENVGVMRGLVEGRVKLGAWKEHLLRDPTRFMEAYLACATAQAEWTGALDERRR